MACECCRVRKAKCDGQTPKCSHCKKASRECVYIPARKRGPNKKSIKKLEERLAFLEHGNLLSPPTPQQQLSPDHHQQQQHHHHPYHQQQLHQQPISPPQSNPSQLSYTSPANFDSQLDDASGSTAAFQSATFPPPNVGPPAGSAEAQLDSFDSMLDIFAPGSENIQWDITDIDAFLQAQAAAMPTAEEAKALEELYFNGFHQQMPMVQRKRYEEQERPLCLRYAVWAAGAVASSKYRDRANSLYRSAREQLEADELSGVGESYLTIYHAQSWILVSLYETLHHSFIRSWMSTRRAVALCQILGLDRVDAPELVRFKVVPQSVDGVEMEERRRIFWAAFGSDRFKGGGHGWPMSVNISDIATNLAGDDQAFENNVEAPSNWSLREALEHGFRPDSSHFASFSIGGYFIGQNSMILRPRLQANSEKLIREEALDMDNSLSKIFLTLPPQLQAINNVRHGKVVHMNAMLHGSVISVQCALSRTLDASATPEQAQIPLRRAYIAAEEIININRLTVHLPGSEIVPFIMFPLYMASRTFLHASDETWGRTRNRSNLDFALAAGYKLSQSHNVIFHLFERLRMDVSQSRFSDLVTDTYKNAVSQQGEGPFNVVASDRIAPGNRVVPNKICSLELQVARDSVAGLIPW